MKTAVECFWLNLTDDLIGDLAPKKILKIYELIEQAKAMEKEQIMDAWDALNYGDTRRKTIIYSSAEEYYNETFKSE